MFRDKVIWFVVQICVKIFFQLFKYHLQSLLGQPELACLIVAKKVDETFFSTCEIHNLAGYVLHIVSISELFCHSDFT